MKVLAEYYSYCWNNGFYSNASSINFAKALIKLLSSFLFVKIKPADSASQMNILFILKDISQNDQKCSALIFSELLQTAKQAQSQEQLEGIIKKLMKK